MREHSIPVHAQNYHVDVDGKQAPPPLEQTVLLSFSKVSAAARSAQIHGGRAAAPPNQHPCHSALGYRSGFYPPAEVALAPCGDPVRRFCVGTRRVRLRNDRAWIWPPLLEVLSDDVPCQVELGHSLLGVRSQATFDAVRVEKEGPGSVGLLGCTEVRLVVKTQYGVRRSHIHGTRPEAIMAET